ncbi:MAG: carboxypeptidase M32 [candidate division Zixibacteria bacterium]|nr:carboxypeptidase M32 [candidate division Zixibacteria bacterium]
MKPQDAYTELKKRMRETALLGSTASILYWDQQAYLPKKAEDHRAEQLGQLSRLDHEWFTDTKVGDWLSAIEDSDLVADPESEVAVNVREWRRLYDREVKLPVEFVEEFAIAGSKGHGIWSEARKKSDFSIFAPHLEKLVELCRRKADLIGFRTERYDALLDEFEPRVKSAEIENVFAGLRKDLVALVAKIADAPRRPNIDVIHQPFDLDRQRIFAESVGAAFGFDHLAGRFDPAQHPSCNALGPHDMRILTRYYPNDLAEGLTAATHEVGHALYDLTQTDKTHWGTPMYETASLGIHESQSRMWENMVGRSRPFWVHFFPQMQRLFPEQLAEATVDDLYGAFNWVKPSLIRVEADEATYNLHIMLRFEIERAIIAGDIAIKDIPGEWNSRFKTYLGIDVERDADGCLQDIHWSDGSFGYFPTYALGNMYAAQYWAQAQKDLPGLADDHAAGNFDRLRGWLSEKIHRQGFKYDAADLCERVTGAKLSHQPLLDYLYAKYEEIYGITRA